MAWMVNSFSVICFMMIFLSARMAAVMAQTEKQISNLVYRGKQSLKTILEQEGFTYADE